VNRAVAQALLAGGAVDIVASWGAALRFRTAGSQDESPGRAIHKQRPYKFNGKEPARRPSTLPLAGSQDEPARRLACDSDYDGFLVFAEGAAEGVGDFAYCGVGFDGGEDGGH